MSVVVGTKLYGYCDGYFGTDSYGDKRVEAIGADWVVARELGGEERALFAGATPNELEKYTNSTDGLED